MPTSVGDLGVAPLHAQPGNTRDDSLKRISGKAETYCLVMTKAQRRIPSIVNAAGGSCSRFAPALVVKPVCRRS